MSSTQYRAGIVGAGYISDFHVQAISRLDQVELVAICDMNQLAAQRLAGSANVAVFADIDEMLSSCELDVVHVLTQPDSHFAIAETLIKAGKHVVLEKPATISASQAYSLEELARSNGVRVAVNHNFVFSRPYNKLRALLDSGELGPLKSVHIVWKKPLGQVKSGPWNLWMLRHPANILFETGSHSLSECLGIVDNLIISSVESEAPRELPSGVTFFRRWHISGKAGDVSIQIDISLDAGYEQHYVDVEGIFGTARADVENDVFCAALPTGAAYDLERLRANCRSGLTRFAQAMGTYISYAGSKFIGKFTGGPYETSMINGISNCYSEIEGSTIRAESSIEFACQIADIVEQAIQKAPQVAAGVESDSSPLAKPAIEAEVSPRILIVGASGFIGRHLLRGFQERKVDVRALVRNASSLTGVPAENLDLMVGDYRDEKTAKQALDGVDVVFHLAVAHGRSLSDYIKADSEPTLEFARLCLDRGVKRFIYSGTIDSLDLASPHTLKEAHGVDQRLARRNNYAHSKALTEQALLDMNRDVGFPVIIIRPAIVLGSGGPVAHVGVADFHGLGHCTYWGQGKNTLPIILVDDVVQALISAVDAADIEGRTFNLSSRSCISARDYVAEVENTLGYRIQTQTSTAFGNWLGDGFKWVIKVIAGHPDKHRLPSIHDWKCREQHADFDTSAAQHALEWQPCEDRETLLEMGIRIPARQFLDE